MDKFFAVCAPGLEPFLAQEIERLGLHNPTVNRRTARAKSDKSPSASRVYPALPFLPDDSSSGGIEFSGSLRDLYRANLWLRTANRILVRLGEFYAAAFPEFRRKAGSLPWERYLAPGQPVALRVTCKKSRLYHSGAVAERVAGAIADRLGQPPPVARFDEDADADLSQLIVVRFANDQCTISVDSSGALLHRRGYRLATAKAPLRETLAAGMLLASDWDKTSPLLDPFCGSGTIPIEAAMMARGIAPGRMRRFACMDWPNFDAAMWKALLVSPGATRESPLPRIVASDRDAGAIESALANAERAGVADGVEFSRRAVSAIEPPGGVGWVVTNPPYGMRVSSGRDLRNLYAQFGNVMRAKCPGWHVAMLCEADSDQLIRNTGLPFDVSRSIALVNGGIRVKLARGQV
jgi:putative N6-adenine-specific DNA methylase